MQLASEDSLRLNVLLRQELHAVRIDESRMVVHALTARGEGQVVLNPTCRDEAYLRLVRELLSNHVLGSPRGYPVYIHRWTRMVQARSQASLENLLKLGEPEAVVAVANTDVLNVELARRAWWALPTEENARNLLTHQCVVEDELGRELADFLLEFLPFEEEPQRVVETVSLLLQPGLLSEDECQQLWRRASHKSAYYPGFLITRPNDLPLHADASAHYPELTDLLQPLIDAGNPFAAKLLWLHGSAGQGFLKTIAMALKRPSNQDVVVALFNAIGHHFRELGLPRQFRDMPSLEAYSAAICDTRGDAEGVPASVEVAAVLERDAGLREAMHAMLSLAQVSEALLDPLFGGNDSIGSVMRKRIRPVSEPLTKLLQVLGSS